MVIHKIESLKKSWLSSLNLFYPAQLRLFLLMTLNATLKTYTLLITLFYPLLIGWAFLELLYFKKFNSGLQTIVYGMNFALFYILILTVRPSMARKNYFYYISYLGYSLGYIGGIIALNVLSFQPFIGSLLNSVLLVVYPPYSPFVLFILFFYLDSDGGLKEFFNSIWRAFLMVVYNYPFCLVAFLITLVLYYLLTVAVSLVFPLFLHHGPNWIAPYMFFMTRMALIPFIASFIGNFYIKTVYEQIKLYTSGCE